MKALTKIVISCCILLLVILVVISNHLFVNNSSFTYDKASLSLEKGWQYSWEGTEKNGVLTLPDVAKGGSQDKTLWISNTLPTEEYNDATLFFRTSQQFIKVFINGQKIYCYTCDSNKMDMKLPGSTFHFIRLPSGYEGKKIEISIVSPYKAYSGHVNSIFIGNKISHIMYIFRRYGSTLLISCIIILLGLILLILSAVMKSHKNKFEGFLYLGLFSFLTGVWILSESKIIQFIIDSPVMIFYIACFSLFIIPIPLLHFILSTYNPKGSKLLLVFNKVFFIFIFVATALQFFQHTVFLQVMIGFHFLLLCCILSIIYVSIKEMLSGNRSIRLFFLGCTILCVFSLIDLVRFYFSNTPGLNAQTFLQYGILIFVMIMTSSLGYFIKDILELQARNEVYATLAFTDVLTGLKNRTSFEERLAELNKNLEFENSISIIVLDLNNLKFVNDAMGHKEGDKIINESASLINECFGEIGETYRIGGDEFVVICIQKSEITLREVLELFDRKVEEYNKIEENVKLGIAYGLASFKQEKDVDLNSLLNRADVAMYLCKQEQKNSDED